jgi:lactoylglutathione lyase
VRIDHLALWTNDIHRSQDFYTKYFGAIPGSRYENVSKGFESMFLSFDGGTRIEIMRTTSLQLLQAPPGAQRMGLTHFAISVGDEHRVDALTHRLREDGFQIVEGPRRTGDGYYESVVLDPDGNRVEISAERVTE